MKNVSVLMSLYAKERADFLNLALESLSAQTLMANEVVLVFDGPVSEQLASVVAYWKSSLNIIIVCLPENVGLSAALNLGLLECNNELVARFDTDDICLPSRLEFQVSFMIDNPCVDICGGNAVFIDSNGVEYSERCVPTEHQEIKRIIWSCPMIHPSVMFRKSRILSIGSYSSTAPHRQDDYDLWIRAIDSGLQFHNLSEYLIQYRYNEDDFKKNSLAVGWNRFKIGVKPWFKYDRRLSSLCGLIYPMVRASLPKSAAVRLNRFVKIYDPRKTN